MFSIFNEDLQLVLKHAQKEMIDLNSERIGTEHILLSILYFKSNTSKILKKYKLDYYKIKKDLYSNNKTNITFINYSKLLKKIFSELIINSKENKEEITTEKILEKIIKEETSMAYRILNEYKVDINSLYYEISKKNKKVLINNYSKLYIDLNSMVKKGKIDKVIGRDEELKRIIEILLRKNKNNPLLVGNAGVGKTAIVEELARRIENKEVPKALLNKRILSIDLASIVSGTKYRGEFEEKMKKIISMIEEDNDKILFIDEVHTIVSAGAGEGAIDAANILKPYLARGNIKLIGATTLDEFKKYIEKDKALERRFQKIIINEPSRIELKEILYNSKSIYEKHHNVNISLDIIDELIRLSNLYVYDRSEPDKSFDILDEVCSKVSLKESSEEIKLKEYKNILIKLNKEKNNYLKEEKYKKACLIKTKEINITNKINELIKIINNKNKKNVTKKDLYEVIENRSNIPILKIKNNNITDKIDELKSIYFNQEKAINCLKSITSIIQANILKNTKCYSLLFTGNSGVGKTSLAKKYAELLTNNVIKIDMNEFTTKESINKLIGSPAGYVGHNENINTFEKIRNKPFSVLILDEIEKADKSIINFFLNILDEGYCNDNKGNVIRFDNVMIIMTSNAIIKTNKVGFNNYKHNNIYSYFPKEFINRIDEIVEFNSFSNNDIKVFINNESKKYNDLKLTDEEINKIIRDSNYKESGVRSIIKIIKKINDKKAISIISE